MLSSSSRTITCFAFRSLKLLKFLPVNGMRYRSNYVIFQWLSIFPPPLIQQPITVPVTRDATFIIYYIFMGIWVYFKMLNIFNWLFCLFIHQYHLIWLLCINNVLQMSGGAKPSHSFFFYSVFLSIFACCFFIFKFLFNITLSNFIKSFFVFLLGAEFININLIEITSL